MTSRVAFFCMALVWFSASLLINAASASQPQPQTITFSVFEDKTTELTLADVFQASEHGEFIPHPSTSFLGGYTRSAFWFQLDLRPFKQQAIYENGLWLEIQPPYLDFLDLHYQDDHGQWQHHQAGNKRPYADQLHPHRSALFVIENLPDYAYLRLQTHSTTILIMNGWSEQAFFSNARNSYVLFALVFGILLTLLVFNLFQGDWIKNRLYQFFVIYLAIFILTMVSVNGFLGLYLLQNWPTLDAMLVPLSFMMLLVAVSVVYIEFLELSLRRTPILFGMTLLAIAAGAIGIIGVFFHFYVDVIPFIGLYVILMYSTWLIKAFYLTFTSVLKFEQILIFLATLSGLLGSITMILVLLGWLSVEVFGLYLFQMTSFVAVLLLQFVMVLKIRHAITQRQSMEKQHQISSERLAITEKVKLEKERFLAMLSHELKTPLSVIQIALEQNLSLPNSKPHALMALKDIDQVIERCTHVQRFEERKTLVNPVEFEPYELLKRVVGYYATIGDIRFTAPATLKSLIWVSDSNIFQVICNNLIDNAVKYSQDNTEISVYLGQTDSGELLLEVKNCVGEYGPPDIDRVFEKYYRSPAAKKVTGSGLGLYLVHGSVDLLGGHIQVKTDDDLVIFTVILPRL
ncbi:integral membrane sensor signal transduction histidine kinase [Thiomicrospira cyclica ALM1]|uniref:histidine kinase n=2 Tax=Thiomicrospira cyclica TaxID=147268 RepID=F6DAI2_THICA|nr:integral membrane sensor signal transduction histidine kinase [Thiomicrospira cyclica ALM1]